MDDKELVKVCNDKVWYANVENTVGVKTIGQLGVTNDNGNKQKKMNNKMKDVSTRNTRCRQNPSVDSFNQLFTVDFNCQMFFP